MERQLGRTPSCINNNHCKRARRPPCSRAHLLSLHLHLALQRLGRSVPGGHLLAQLPRAAVQQLLQLHGLLVPRRHLRRARFTASPTTSMRNMRPICVRMHARTTRRGWLGPRMHACPWRCACVAWRHARGAGTHLSFRKDQPALQDRGRRLLLGDLQPAGMHIDAGRDAAAEEAGYTASLAVLGP